MADGTSPGGEPEVRALGLAKTYRGGVVAVRDVSLRVAAGEIVGIVGPNGAGKSTTLKMLATLLTPTAGSARICGLPVEDVERVRPLLGIALQEVGLDPLMSGREHFTIQAAIDRADPATVARRLPHLVERLNLEAYLDRRVGTYSGGTQRRLALALALLGDPRVVIFDEPTAGLDPRARREVWAIAEELRMSDRALLLSTQYLEEADALCDRIYLIDEGAIVAEGTPASLKEGVPGLTLTLELDRPPDREFESLIDSLPARIASLAERDVVLEATDAAVGPGRLVQEIETRGFAMRSFSVAAASLDDVFIHHTRRALEPEPEERATMDLGTRMHRGGGKRWR